MLYLQLQYCYKGMYTGQGSEGAWTWTFQALSLRSQDVTLLAPRFTHQSGSSPKPRCLEFPLGLHYIPMTDWITGHVIALQSASLPLPEGQTADGSSLPFTCLVFLVTRPHPEATLGPTRRHLTSITKTLLSRREFHGLWKLKLETEAKMQTYFLLNHRVGL